MMTSSNLTSSVCCFDFGSAETNDSDDGNATMNAIYYGSACWVGGCTGQRPLGRRRPRERHVLQRHRPEPREHHQRDRPFVSAWEKNNGTTNFTLKYGNGQHGRTDTTIPAHCRTATTR